MIPPEAQTVRKFEHYEIITTLRNAQIRKLRSADCFVFFLNAGATVTFLWLATLVQFNNGFLESVIPIENRSTPLSGSKL